MEEWGLVGPVKEDEVMLGWWRDGVISGWWSGGVGLSHWRDAI